VKWISEMSDKTKNPDIVKIGVEILIVPN